MTATILDQIGNTPLIRLERCVPANGAEVWLKLEYRNPTGSMKDRMALSMIEGAERDGLIDRETTIVEYTGGSTGPALALVCAAKGYHCKIVIADCFTEERLQLMRALGAELEIVPSVEGPPRVTAEDIRRMVERAGELAAEPGHYATDQFNNPYVVPGHRENLGREIWEQAVGRVTAFCQGIGTAGSVMGVAQALEPHGVHICALEPAGSAAISGGPTGSFAMQGWTGIVPPHWDPEWVDEVQQIDDDEALAMTVRLAREEGVFAGISTGANVAAALRLGDRLGPDAVVVTIAVDTGFKYMTVPPYAAQHLALAAGALRTILPLMSAPRTTTESDLKAVAEAIRSRDRFLVISHENPDGDALGSLLAMHLALRQLGKDSMMMLAGDVPLPAEYRFMALGELRREPPPDAGERVLLAVDCAKEERIGAVPELLEQASLVVDVDHHHDNSRFGQVNLIVADASSTGEILRDLFRELGVELTPEIAEPLYIALVTDTGRFQYSNTTPKALRLAAELVEAGADVRRVFRGVYENVQLAKLKLLARALERAEVSEGGRLVISYLRRTDFEEVGAEEPYSEGIIDSLRAVEGSEMAALIREPPRDEGPNVRVSLRASHDELDVSSIARKRGGGGHRQAAGFSSDEPIEQVAAFIRREFAHAAAGA